MDKGSMIALAVAAFAAGIALAGFLRPPSPAPIVLPAGGMAAPAEPEPRGGLPGMPEEPAKTLAELQDDVAALSQIIRDIAETYGELRDRVEALEARLGATPPPGGPAEPGPGGG